MDWMRRLLPLVALALATSACNPFQSSGSGGPATGGATVSPSPSAPLPQSLWVLSPVGLKLRDAPNSSGRQIATVPQGTQVTPAAFQSTDVGWYQVTYQGTTGWIAAKDDKGNDVEVDEAKAAAAGQTNPGGAPQQGSAKMTVHLAGSVDQLGNIPTT